MKSLAGIPSGATHAALDEHNSVLKAAMFLSHARAEEGLQLRGAVPLLLPSHSNSRCPGHPPMGSPVERGYTGPPVPADLCSSDRD
jgi:hypothetical protein